MIFAFCGNWCLHVRAVNQAWKDKIIRQLENSRQRGWRNSKVNALQSFCDIFSPSRLRSFRTSRNGFIILWPLTFEATVIINSLEHHNENRKGEPDVWRFCWLCIKRGFTSACFQQGGGGRPEVALAVYSLQLHWPVMMLGGRGGLHDDAWWTAFGDLLHSFSIVGVLNFCHDLWEERKTWSQRCCNLPALHFLSRVFP